MVDDELSSLAQKALDCDLCEGYVKVHWYCLTCTANICEKCLAVHSSRKAFKKHDVISRELHKEHIDKAKLESIQKCLFHNHDVIMTCVTCAVPLCIQCILSAHSGHACQSLQTKLQKSKEKLSKYIKNLNEKDKLIMEQLKKNNDTQNTIDDEKEETRKEIIKARDDVIASIKAESELLIEEMEKRMKKSENEISKSNLKLRSGHNRIQTIISNAQTKLEGQSSTVIDQFMKDVEDNDDIDISVSLTLSAPKFEAQVTPTIGKLSFDDRTVRNDPPQLRFAEESSLHFEDGTVENAPLYPLTVTDVKVIQTFNAKIRATEIRTLSSNQIWCSHSDERSLQMYDKNGKEIQSISLTFNVQGFVLNKFGHFIVSDRVNGNIKQVTSDGHVRTLCSTAPTSPWGICLNHEQQLVVCMKESLVVYSTDCKTKLQEFTHDQHGKPLFVFSYKVAVHRDYYVADIDGKKVVAIDAKGKLRWTYNGGSRHVGFEPWNICCDGSMYVIVADSFNHKVHLLDKDGELIKYISDDVSIQFPLGLAVFNDGTLLVGEDDDSKLVHVVKYLTCI